MKKALLYGGPLNDTWWTIDDEELPRYLVPQEGLGTHEPVLLADFPVPSGSWRYQRDAREDSRVVYVWAQEERPPMEFEVVIQDGPAAGYRMHVLGLTEPYPYMRLAPRPTTGPLDGGHMEWLHIPWPDAPAWDGESTYALTGTLIPPRGGTPEAFYSVTDSPPWATIDRAGSGE